MRVNGSHISNLYNASLLHRSVEPIDFENELLTPYGSNSNIRYNRNIGSKILNLSIEFKGDPSTININNSKLTKALMDNPVITFDSLPDMRFTGYLDLIQNSDSNFLFQIVELVFIAVQEGPEEIYEMDSLGYLSIWCDGTMDTPVIFEVTNSTGSMSNLTVTGFNSEFSIVSGDSGLVVNSVNSTVKTNGVNSIGRFIGNTFPKLKPGYNDILAVGSSGNAVNYKVKFRPRWL